MLGDDFLDELEHLRSGSVEPDVCDEADDVEGGRVEVVGNVADNTENRHPPCHMADDASYHLAREGLAVEVTLTCHHQVASSELPVEVDELRHELEAGCDPRPQGGESSG